MIEKKRRDRINASLGELRRLVPAAARDPHSGKLEKAEILQLTVEHLRTLRNKGKTVCLFQPSRFRTARIIRLSRYIAEISFV